MKTRFRNIWIRIKRFFFPSHNVALWKRLLPYSLLGFITISLITITGYTWTYTNSSVFCGTTCHTMPPEYSAYLHSPHARVNCVECHIGRDIITTQVTRKAGDLRHVFYTLTQTYEFPIYSRAMRPARDSCEKCHFPEKFSDDSLRVRQNYASDENNTPSSTFLVMKTGGGSQREGLGRGIHWHVENEVLYLATDEHEQNIPYVRVVDPNGDVTEYYDVSSGFSPEDISGEYLKRMDCLNCHNRVTHTMPFPETSVDQAIAKHLIPNDLPFVREQSVKLLYASYPDKTTAISQMENLGKYYQDTYPEIYKTRLDDINQAIVSLQDIYTKSVFPEQKMDWNTHLDNLGHKNSPGCFRCHDGKHIAADGEAIRLECNLCHSIPVMSQPGALVTKLEIVSGPEPSSHTHTSWIALHGDAIDISCAACHPPEDPATNYLNLDGPPVPDTSFCGNSACHASEWNYIGFDDPAMSQILETQLYILFNTSPYLFSDAALTYEGTFKAMFEGRCIYCHGEENPTAGLVMTNYEGLFIGGISGPGIVPGDPDNSTIYLRQSTSRGHFGQLLPEELAALFTWIMAGAPLD
ncbi:MAG: NapC/NirT family cytochrome c [Chloroflexota bacterium]